MSAFLRDLGATDPGLLFAIGILIGATIAIAGLALCMAWGPTTVSGDEGGASS